MSAQARLVQRITREDMDGGSDLEVTVNTMLQRGYRLSDIKRIHAPQGSAEHEIGEAIESAVRRSVRRTGRLPCGEPVRLNPERASKDCWLAFQFETGTKGDSLVQGGFQHPDEFDL